MSKILRYLACLFMLIFAGNALAAGYSCPSYKKYTSCASGYYMATSSSSTVYNGTPRAGNACRPCSDYGSYYTCAGGTSAPVKQTVTITYNLNGGSGTKPANKTCNKGASCSLQSGATTTFYRAGYVFKGWSTSSTATSGSTSMTFTANDTVYAVWSACSAGTYKPGSGTQASASCSACTGRTKYSAAGASSCKTVSSGYYTTGCNSSGNNCTGQSQCTGATYCSSGVQNSCPAQTSGWTRNSGTGWTSYTQCNQTRAATSASTYCSAGTLKQNATSATAWGATTVSSALSAKAGAYVNGTTCTQCQAGYACPGGTSGRSACSGSLQYQNAVGQTSCKTVSDGFYKSSNSAQAQCPSGYRDGAGAANQNSCVGSFTKTGSQTTPSMQTGCAARTLGTCTPGTCTYTKQYSGTIVSDCTPTNCTKPQTCTSADDNYYLSGGSAAKCGSSYPYSDGGNISSSYCYKYGTKTGSQVNGSVPTNCASVTSWNSCTPGTCQYKDYNGATDGTCTPSNCTKTPKAVTAKENFYVNGTSCSACPSGYPKSDGGNISDAYCYVTKTKTGNQVNGSVPANCASVTSWNSCTPGTCSYRDYQSATDTTCTPSNCTKTPAAVTADAGYYDNGTSCSACPSAYPNSADGNEGGISKCYMSVSGGKYVATANATSVSTCEAGTYKAAHTVYYGSTSSCSACTGRTKYSADGASACSTVGSGYYTTGCNTSGNNCTGQSQCTGATYCSSGVQNNCPSGYTANTTAGKTAASSCQISCSGGTYVATANAACTSVGTGYYRAAHTVNYGSTSTRTQCPANYRSGAAASSESGCKTSCAGGTYVATAEAACTAVGDGYYRAAHSVSYGSTSTRNTCPSGYPNSDAGAAAITSCYSNSKSRAWTGEQISCATPTGCSDSTCNTCTLPACSYVAYSNSTGSADGTIKSGCSTNSEDCQQTVKSVTAKAGRYVSGITCPACAVGTFQGTDDSTATSCSVCAANTYAASTGMSACTACPSGYSTSGTAASNHDAKSDCSITCAAGTRVVTADAACTTPTGSWYTASHSVTAGSTTPTTTVKACLTNYSTPNTTARTDHDASTDCKISCAAGTRITAANATSCTTPAGNWYVGAHSVAQGSISSYSNCLTNYTISGTAAANHDTASDCKISCGGGSYIATANNTTCSDVGAGYWAAASTVSQGSAGVRNACDDGLTTIGSGAGADEVGDCGRVLNVNGEKIYLRSERKTTPSLNVSINGTTFYGNMGASGIGALKLNSGGTTYSVYDDSME
ncbi:MAG TPA: InlB B-repeat-containing protein [Candidatus Enterousia intestinigallinarum]|uniref:InlB B-repeat-containing protein n=1 Tax=Candidatus Enterousia intestinigallinarum TaxID=2840790 RepID=A0A9D1JW81_9PROT|nr:InlB B-repeat-containing protein [Candidatus Enterousia intestinigallinarum]